MKIIVSIKQVPVRDSQLRIDSNGRWIQENDLSFEINEPDAYALEEALQLKEKNGSRRISMAVGSTEALAIAQQRGSTTIPPDQQPQAYILLRDTIQQLGGRIDRVVVNDATQKEYLAQVVVSNNGDVKVIKARPGDAIALALKSGAPIFVENQVLDKFGTKV